MDYRIISIGAMARHELWQEQAETRTAHGTSVLIRSGDRVILVDPGLPPAALGPRLSERAGLAPEAITDVFLTNFRPARRWGLALFPEARWLISEMEREAIGQRLVQQFQAIDSDDETRTLIKHEIDLLKRCQAAPDRLADHVDLFPLPGSTPGTCGLLLSQPNATVLIASDAVPTWEHLDQGRIPRDPADGEQARESFLEAVEIADVIIPGYDNLVLNPSRRSF